MSAGPFSAWERAVALRYLRARKGEAGLSVIAVISLIAFTVAVFALITVMSVMNGFRTELYDRTLGFNGHIFVAGPALNGDVDPMLRRIRAIDGVTQAQPLIESQALVQGPIGAAGAIVRGIRPDDLRATSIITANLDPHNALSGFGQGENGGDQVIVGARLADALGVRAGDQITITSPSGGATAFGALPMRATFTVAGTFSVGMSEFDQAFIYMPMQQAQVLFGRTGGYDVVEIKLHDPDVATGLRPAVQQAAGPGAVVTDWTQRNQAYFNALNIERNVMRLILSILVILAGLLVLSSLIMLVKIKARDIAILRTMGASRGAVLRIFIMTGATIGVVGTLAGFALGVLFCLNIEAIQDFIEHTTHAQLFSADIYFLNHIPARIEWPEVIIIASMSILASFLFTLWPAYDASSLDPVEALRYE